MGKRNKMAVACIFKTKILILLLRIVISFTCSIFLLAWCKMGKINKMAVAGIFKTKFLILPEKFLSFIMRRNHWE